MCEYCGCQEIDAIAELTAEHDKLRDLGRNLTDAADAHDLAAVRSIAEAMQAVLVPHTAVEERALFPPLMTEFGDQLAGLTGEHREIDAMLGALAGAGRPADDWPALCRQVVTNLFEHILKEQDGVFPAALSTLRTADWDAVDKLRKSVGSAITTRR